MRKKHEATVAVLPQGGGFAADLEAHQQRPEALDRYGWPVDDWAHATGISRASVYNLLGEHRVESVKFGGKRLITTHPRDFLRSLTEAHQ